VGGFFENSVALFDASGGLIWEDIELGEPAARVSVALDPVTGDPHALRQDNSSTGSILRFHKDFGFVRDVEFVAAQMLAYLPDGRQVLTGPLGVQIDALDTAFPTGYRGVARDVAVGTDGSIYVADGNQIFHLDGTTGETLHRLEGLESLTGIGVSDAGRVYVVDQAASTISVFSAELTFLKSRETIDELGEPFRPWDVAVMEDGRVAVSDPEPGSDIFLFPTF
jgi:DNA-binding beta-propeller fold protein YncE